MNNRLRSSSLDVMNFLNEVIETYPDAISFASGRPSSDFIDLRQSMLKLGASTDVSDLGHCDEVKINTESLTQYGKTSGLFNCHIARYLSIDEHFHVDENDIVITNGCQEALVLCIDTLFNPDDVLLVLDPTYIGIVGVCQMRGVEVDALDSGVDMHMLVVLKHKISQAQSRGKNIRALYLIPDFSNPMGESIPLDLRLGLIEFCAEHGISIFEDSAYRCFSYASCEREIPPMMAQLDHKGTVIHIGSFSKTICPGLRVGYIVSSTKHGHRSGFTQDICRVKSFTTLNTPPLTQAIAASVLVEHQHSLKASVEGALQVYKANCDRLLMSLDECFDREYREKHGVSWSIPEGGFFLTVEVPFSFDMNEAAYCAKEFGVICVPVSIFSLLDKFKCTIRLSFSYVQLDEIQEGCLRFSRYIKSKLNKLR